MVQAVITLAVLVVAAICGTFLPPSEEQTRALIPEKGDMEHGAAHHDSHH